MQKKHDQKIIEQIGHAAKGTREKLQRRNTASPRRWQIPFEIKLISLNPHQKFDPADGYLKQVAALASLTPKKQTSKEMKPQRQKSVLENTATRD